MGEFVVVSCEVLKSLLEDRLDGVRVEYLKQGLHDVPVKLKAELQQTLDSIEEPSVVLVGYGLCGNGLDGIKSGKHWLVIPRTHDCIPLILGSYERYMEEFNSGPGTYYMSKGWISAGTEPLKKHEEYIAKYGKETAEWLAYETTKNYTRVAFVAAEESEIEEYGDYAQQVADFCKVPLEILKGSTQFITRLIDKAKDKDAPDPDFLVIPPGEEVKQGQFLR